MWVTADIDFEDAYSNLRDRDKQILVEWLEEDGYLTKRDTEYDEPASIGQQMFNENVDKLRGLYYQLTSEEIELIEKLTKKY